MEGRVPLRQDAEDRLGQDLADLPALLAGRAKRRDHAARPIRRDREETGCSVRQCPSSEILGQEGPNLRESLAHSV